MPLAIVAVVVTFVLTIRLAGQRVPQPARAERGPNGWGEPGPVGGGQPPAVPEGGEELAGRPPAACCRGRAPRACGEADSSIDGCLGGSGAIAGPVAAPLHPVGVLVAPRSPRRCNCCTSPGRHPQARRFRAGGPVGDGHELVRGGRLPAAIGRNRRQIQRPRDRLDAHRAPPAGCGAPPPVRQPAGSVSVSFTPVRSCSPANANRLPAQVRYTRGQWRMAQRSPRKRVRGQPLRGFKSHLHRRAGADGTFVVLTGGNSTSRLGRSQK
jgi:hypothetical protein